MGKNLEKGSQQKNRRCVKNDEKKLKKAHVQNSKIGTLLIILLKISLNF